MQTSPFQANAFHYSSKDNAERAQFKFERKYRVEAWVERNGARPEGRNFTLQCADGFVVEAFA